MKSFNDLYNVMKLMQNMASKIQIWILQPTGPRKAKAINKRSAAQVIGITKWVSSLTAY